MHAEVAHHIALIPGLCALAVIVIVVREGREVATLPPLFWASFGLFISWWGDWVAGGLSGSVKPSYIWLPIQIWVVLQALIRTPLNRVMSGFALLILAATSWNLTGPGPDILMTFFGTLAITRIVTGKLTAPLFIYFGLGSPAYFLMMYTETPGACFFYDCCRLMAYILLIGIVAPPLIQRRRADQWLKTSFPGP
jgi:hypothetical protein